MKSKHILLAFLLIGVCAAAGTTSLSGLIQVCDEPGSCPTGSTATGAGDVIIEDALEVDGATDLDGALSVAGAATLSGAVSMESTLAVTGNSTFTGAARASGGSITDTTALDADDCGHAFAVTAGIDTKTITLPDADQVLGCELTFSYVGADGGALVDISPLDSDADGIEGGCYETATDTVVYFSGTADADIGLTKSTALTGDYIKLWACGAAMWCVVGCQGIWANN